MTERNQTALVFEGNSFKYEMENVTKLFFPLRHFAFRYDGVCPEENFVFFLMRELGGGNVRLLVQICLPAEKESGPIVCQEESVMPVGLPENQYESELARLLYAQLSQHTGIRPAWGILTGVRPVKLVQKRLAAGMDDDQIRREMTGQDLVSEGKIDLALKIAHVQHQMLQGGTSRDYSLYLSIPYCPSRCSYCSFVSQSISGKKAQELLPRYLMALIKELRVTAELAQKHQLRLRSIYLGGGTPTVLSASQLRQLTGAVKDYFLQENSSLPIEYTIEAGRPDTITPDKLEVIKGSGATRISINPQTFSDEVLRRIGRAHTAQDVIDCYHLARSMGFDDINMDLIAALPGETLADFARTLETTVSLAPESVTVHALAIKRSSRLHEQMHVQGGGHGLTPASEAEQMTALARKTLTGGGWKPYYLYRQKYMAGNLENVGYARPGMACLYNIGNMEETASVLALGAGAITKWLFDRARRIERAPNVKNIEAYIQRVEEMAARKRQLIFS